MRLPDPALLLVTDRKQAATALADVVKHALAGGCRWVSLREKDLPEVEQIELANSLKSLAGLAGARLTLHGAPEVAKACGVDGVHLPSGADAAGARAMLGRAALVGISIHRPDEAQSLDPATVDYAVAGPVFATASKPGYGPVLGIAGLAAIAAATSVPIIAIGGIEPSNVSGICQAGASGVAVMGGPMRAPDPAEHIRRLIDAMNETCQARAR